MNHFGCLLRLAGKSAWNRKSTLVLMVFSIALSTTLLIGIKRIRSQLRESFVQAVSGTMLLAGLIMSLGPVLAENYDLRLYLSPLESGEWVLVGGIMGSGFLASLIPALRAYHMSLVDGLNVST